LDLFSIVKELARFFAAYGSPLTARGPRPSNALHFIPNLQFVKSPVANHPFRLDFPSSAGQARFMDQPPFRHIHRVTYADCTAGNHIYYSRYLDLLEAARGEFFRHLGTTFLQWQEQGIIFPVIECHLRYKAPARYDDVLTIELWPAAAERIRLDFGSRIVNQAGTLILEAETRHVCTGLDEKPKRLPDELVKLLQPWVRA
jgi:acyl-CoA thioester hydrolase